MISGVSDRVTQAYRKDTVEEAVVRTVYQNLAYRQSLVSKELRKNGILVSGGGVCSIWQRHSLENFKKRLSTLEEKAAKEGIVYTEVQLKDLKTAKRERESDPDEIETATLDIFSVKTHFMLAI